MFKSIGELGFKRKFGIAKFFIYSIGNIIKNFIMQEYAKVFGISGIVNRAYFNDLNTVQFGKRTIFFYQIRYFILNAIVFEFSNCFIETMNRKRNFNIRNIN